MQGFDRTVRCGVLRIDVDVDDPFTQACWILLFWAGGGVGICCYPRAKDVSFCFEIEIQATPYVLRLCSKRVFLLGPSHHHYLNKIALTKCAKYATPLGDIPIDTDGKSEQLPCHLG